MLVMLLVSFLAALVLCCILFPSVWDFITAGDDLDAHEAGLAFVAYRHPVQESGSPISMAKLIMLRHKIHQVNTKRRCSVSHTRQVSRTFNAPSVRPLRSVPWGRFGRANGKQYH